jgi:hypothetical protein
MPDEIVESSAPTTSPVAAARPSANAIRRGIGFCGAIIAVSFFLPWINFFEKQSLLDLAQQPRGALPLVWAVPIFGIVALLASITKTSLKAAACLAGIVPLIVLGYGFADSGADLLKILDVGAYVGVVASFGALALASRLKSSPNF